MVQIGFAVKVCERALPACIGCLMLAECSHLCSLASDATCKLDVLGHDGNALSVDGAQVGVLEQTHQVGLCSLLLNVLMNVHSERTSLHQCLRL